MKTKNLITLAIAALIVVLLAVLCLTGIRVGKYILIPAADGITRGSDFTVGTYAVISVNEPQETVDSTGTAEETEDEQTDDSAEEVAAVPASEELFNETFAIMQRRVGALVLDNVSVAKQGENRIRIEIPVNDVTSAAGVLSTLTQPFAVEFTDGNGDVVLRGEDILSCKLRNDRQNSAYYLSIKVKPEAQSALTEATEDANTNLTVTLDGKQVCTTSISQMLSKNTGMRFSSYTDAVTMLVALNTGHITANIVPETSGSIPAVMSEKQFDASMAALGVAVLIAAVVMMIVFKGTGFVSALSIVLGAIAVLFFFGSVPYISFNAISFYALAAALAIKVLCDLDLLGKVRSQLAAGMGGKEAVSMAWRDSGLKTFEISCLALVITLCMQFFGDSSISAFTSVFAVGTVISLLVTVAFTRPLITCVVDKAVKVAK